MVEIAYFFDSINYDEAAQADFNDGMLRPSGIFPESLLARSLPLQGLVWLARRYLPSP
jgi:hypothetical protein